MGTRKLELKDICGYLPYGLEFSFRDTYKLLGKDFTLNKNGFFHNGIPILRPLSDLYKTITHNGKEIVPIVELANLSFCFDGRNKCWVLNGHYAEYNTGYDYIKFCYSDTRNCFDSTRGTVRNQYKLFDYLNELKIDYRRLIDAGLAIDVNTLNENPYK